MFQLADLERPCAFLWSKNGTVAAITISPPEGRGEFSLPLQINLISSCSVRHHAGRQPQRQHRKCD
jgi:hypothetical protein